MGSGVAFFDADGDGLQDLFFVNGKAWPGRIGSARPARALSQQWQGLVRRRHPDLGTRGRAVRDGRRTGRLRQRRRSGPLRHGGRRQSALPQRRQGRLHGRDRARGRRDDDRLLDGRRLARLRQGRLAGSVRRELRAVGARHGHQLLARRQGQVVLHARGVQGGVAASLSQQARRYVRRGHEAGRPGRSDGQGPRDRAPRLQRRRLARSLRRQRHAAEPTLPQHGQRASSWTTA